ncbi:MAG: family 78 glycoside hydrolase catalytic domain [Tepidisphaeraceae bacterium]
MVLQILPCAVMMMCVLAVGVGCTSTSSARLKASELQVEHRREPLGLDRPTPRLSWVPMSKASGEGQSAYRVVVASSRELLDTPDLWDSGKVASDQTFGIRYAGKPLATNQAVFWKVQLWDRVGSASPWSEVSHWSMGMLKPDDWKATWIGYDAARDTLPPPVDPFEGSQWIACDEADDSARTRWLSTQFALNATLPIESAVLTVTADDEFEFNLNGKACLSGKGWGNPQHADVADLLKVGANDVLVKFTNTAKGPMGLVATLSVRTRDGNVTIFRSDKTWRAAKVEQGPWTSVRVIGAYGEEKPYGKINQALTLEPTALLRKEFTVSKKVRRATMHYAVLGCADLYLNGQHVTDDYFTSGWTDYTKRVYARSYDVTDKVTSGDNALVAEVAPGWFTGYVGWARHRDHYGTHPRLLAQLVIDYDDGTQAIVATDPSWKAASGPRQFADLLMGESFDARKFDAAFYRSRFNDGAWKPVDIGTSKLSPVVQAHPGQPVRVIESFKPAEITQPKPGVYVVNFGQNVSGVTRLHVTGKAGQTIKIRHAERLNPDGTIYTTNLRAALATDYYTLRGDTKGETWTPRFTFHGFQYVELTGLDAAPMADTITALQLSSDTPIAGAFESSDPMLNRLHSNIYHTQVMNFIDVPTDCPQRDERLGWTGDAQVYIRTASQITDVHAFFDKWLVDLSDAQRADGQFPKVAPIVAGQDDGGPAWSEAGVICPWTIYDVYGDRDLLARQYDSMKRFADFCVSRSTPELLPPKDYHCFGDWLSIKADTPKDVIYQAYMAHTFDLMTRAATALGHTDDAAKYADLFKRAVASFNKAYVKPDGEITGNTQCCYVLAIAYDLLDEAGMKKAGERLVVDIESRGGHLSTGFVGTKDLMLALAKIGRNDVALRLVHNESFPSWGFSIKHGATSIWERWDGWTPENGFQDPGMNSFAHYSFGAVYQWMVENLGGIRNGGDAYKHVIIQPTFDPKLSFANTKYDSVRGTIESKWKREGGKVTIDITLPANTSGELVLGTKHVLLVSGQTHLVLDAK